MNQLQTVENKPVAVFHESSTQDLLLNSQVYSQVERFSNLMASGKATVPKHLQGSAADCMAVTMQAMQWGMNPFAVAQKTHLVNGTLGYEAQLVNAVISSSKAIEGRFHYEYGGDWKSDNDPTAWVKVGAILKGEKDITWGEPLFPAKQTVKNSPVWKTDPKQQSAYLALKKWARLYAPAVILGVYTSDELEVMEPRDITPKATTVSSLLGEDAASNAIEHEQPKVDLKKVLASIKKAKTIEDLQDVANDAHELSAEDQAKARDAYKKKRDEIEGVQPSSLTTLGEKVALATSHEDVDAIIGLPEWSELQSGEAQYLQQVIEQKRADIDAAAGLFEQGE